MDSLFWEEVSMMERHKAGSVSRGSETSPCVVLPDQRDAGRWEAAGSGE